MQWMVDCWMEGNSASKWHDTGDHLLPIVVIAAGGDLVLALVAVHAPGAAHVPVPAIHAQGLAVVLTPVLAAVPGHVQTARALAGNLIPVANLHVKAKASPDLSRSEQGDGG